MLSPQRSRRATNSLVSTEWNSVHWLGPVCYFMVWRIPKSVSIASWTLTGWAELYRAILVQQESWHKKPKVSKTRKQLCFAFGSFFIQTILQCYWVGTMQQRETYSMSHEVSWNNSLGVYVSCLLPAVMFFIPPLKGLCCVTPVAPPQLHWTNSVQFICLALINNICHFNAIHKKSHFN